MEYVCFDDYVSSPITPNDDLPSFFLDLDSSNSLLSVDQSFFDLDNPMPKIYNDISPSFIPDSFGLDLSAFKHKRVKLSPDSTSSSSELSTPMSSPSIPVYRPSEPRPRAPRKQSESRIPLPDLHARMGLGHDPDEARTREQHILSILQDQGFPLGERTWIRDTEEKDRRRMIDEIYRQTRDLYGYDRPLLEVIVRRGAYYLMQGRLRRLRRSRRHDNHQAIAAHTTITTTSPSSTTCHDDLLLLDRSSRSSSES
ncbi:hypothetical protein V1512DRAFT_257762 [Lipomyces arxii]|uniref:uncharacterized protein n=1 Tax=Lipomyces arxii TaxID=56418 RepID=UPI0034CD7493